MTEKELKLKESSKLLLAAMLARHENGIPNGGFYPQFLSEGDAPRGVTMQTLRGLEKRRWVYETEKGAFRLTSKGLGIAQTIFPKAGMAGEFIFEDEQAAIRRDNAKETPHD